MYNIKIKHFKNVDPETWNRFVIKSDSAWVYHLWEWQDLMSKSWEGLNLSFAIGEDDKMTGILPAFQMKGNPALIDSGFGVGGFAYLGKDDKISMLKVLLSSIRNIYWNVYNQSIAGKWFRMTLPAGIDAIEADYHEYMKSGFFRDCSEQTVVIDLTEGEEALVSGYSTTTRQNIATAKKKGLVCDELPFDSSSFDFYYKMHVETYRRTGINPHPESYFRSMYELMKSAYRLFVAFDSYGKAVSAINVAVMKSKGLYSTGASLESGLKLNASKSVQDYAMKTLMKDGFKFYEMGEVHPEAKPEDGKVYGLTRFKKSFGGRIVPFRKVICKLDEILNVS